MKKLLSLLAIAPLAVSACSSGAASGTNTDNGTGNNTDNGTGNNTDSGTGNNTDNGTGDNGTGDSGVDLTNSTLHFTPTTANRVHYAGSMVGEPVTLGDGVFEIFDNGNTTDVHLSTTWNYEFEIIGKEKVDTSRPGTYDLEYVAKAGGKTTTNKAKLKYSVYDPITSKINTVQSQTTANILYVHVNAGDAGVTMPPQNYVEEWKKQMTEAYNYNYEGLNFNIDLEYKALTKSTDQLLADWNALPTTAKTNNAALYGLDYYMFTQGIKDRYSAIDWGKYDAVAFSVSRTVANADDGPLGLAELDISKIPEVKHAFPDILPKLKNTTQTIHKGTVGVGYYSMMEMKPGATNYKPDFYKAESGVHWTLSDPQASGLYQDLIASEIGSKGLQGNWDMSRVSAADFPTVKSNLIGGNKWYNAIGTIMHETVHTFHSNHSKAPNKYRPTLYSKFLDKPWSKKSYAYTSNKTDAECAEIDDSTDDCHFLYDDYLDPFDNMSSGELAERFSVNTRGTLFGSKYDRVNPTSTGQTITVKPGVKEFKEIYLLDANAGAKAEGGKYKNHLHTLSIEFFGNDPLTSHFNDYGILKDNLEGVIIRYTMINLSDFSRDTVLLDGTYDPADPMTFMGRDRKYAFKAGSSLTFQGVKIDITNIDQAAGATFTVTKV